MENSFNNTPVTFDKTLGVVAYMTLIGWIIALIQNNEKTGEEKRFAAYHLRQMLGLLIIALVVYFVRVPFLFIPFIGALISVALTLGLLAFWIIAVMGASNGERKPVPVVGETIQRVLGNAFE